MTRMLISTGNIIVSLILGALLFGYVFINYPDLMGAVFDAAASFKSWLINRGLSSEYNNWIRALVEERQLAFMGFTVVARIMLSLVTLPIVLWRERA